MTRSVSARVGIEPEGTVLKTGQVNLAGISPARSNEILNTAPRVVPEISFSLSLSNVVWAHQSSPKAQFLAASRVASMSSMSLFAPGKKVDMKSAPGPVRASRTDRRSDRSCP
jgi:hypothetical protein